MASFKARRTIFIIVLLILSAVPLYGASIELPTLGQVMGTELVPAASPELKQLAVKGRAPKTGYERSNFGDGWGSIMGCDTRNVILVRDLRDVTLDDRCRVLTGKLDDPYTGKIIDFQRGETTSDDVQIDHVVALSNAWQTGAQVMNEYTRISFANDPLNLLAVDGTANEQKSDGDAATWLPPNKSFRCEYVKRQISVKKKYELWVTPAERDAMARVLNDCSN